MSDFVTKKGGSGPKAPNSQSRPLNKMLQTTNFIQIYAAPSYVIR